MDTKDDDTMPASTATPTEIYEIAYHLRGANWKRKTFKSKAAMNRFIERLVDEDPKVEIRWAT